MITIIVQRLKNSVDKTAHDETAARTKLRYFFMNSSKCLLLALINITVKIWGWGCNE